MASEEQEIFHKIPLAELEKKLKTNFQTGLTTADHETRLDRDGENIQTKQTVQLSDWEKKWEEALPKATLVRLDGKIYKLKNEELVVGDVVIVVEGDVVPADIRLMEINNIKVDVSRLTAETDPKDRTLECTSEDMLNSSNVLLQGSFVLEGSAIGVIFATGNNTIMGRTVGGKVIKDPAKGRLPKAIIKLCDSLFQNHGIYIKNVEKYPTISNIDWLIMPLRGVLTYSSKMAVVNLFFNNDRQKVTKEIAISPTFEAFLEAMSLCNSAEFDPTDKSVLISTNYYDTALFNFCSNYVNVEEIREKRTKVIQFPFDRMTLTQMSVHKNHQTQRLFCIVKGSPEGIISICQSVLINGQKVPMEDGHRDSYERANHRFASDGESMIAVATIELDPQTFNYSPDSTPKIYRSSLPKTGYTLIGVGSISNPLKSAITETVELFRKLGIRLILASSDHLETVRALAAQSSMISADTEPLKEVIADNVSLSSVLLSGDSLASYLPPNKSTSLWKANTIIVGRLKKHQKLAIVETIVKRGEIVATIGQGLNDSSALAKSQVGIVFAGLGPFLMKEKADLIVINNRLISVAECIETVRSTGIDFEALSKQAPTEQQQHCSVQ